jgi:CubicO group peptidase (beta-lactamase class C family)
MMKKTIICLLIIIFITGFPYQSFALDQKNQVGSIDEFIYKKMTQYDVPVVSLAIIEYGKIIYKKAYSLDKKLTVTPHSLFQSASVGKSVTAYGALRLVDKGKIKLDENLNHYLISWKIPDSPFTARSNVTLRNVLDMTSGLSVPGFFGHSVHDVLPTLKQILNGESPAENKPVRVIFLPGSQYYYSGGSYEVVEQLIEDLVRKSFSTFMQEEVLFPLDMKKSQFIAVLSKASRSKAVPGFLKNGKMIEGKWKIIPALGAGGLWATPTDLAKFTLNIFQSYEGKAAGLLSKKLAYEMLTRQKNTDFGLGFVIDGCGKNLNFRKEGHNIGFYNWLIGFPYTQQGAVIMTNSENGMPLIKDLIQKISQTYKWPKHYPIVDESERIAKHSSCH